MIGNSEWRKNLDNAGEIRVGSVIFALDIFPGAPLQNLGGFSECYGCVRVAATTQSEEDPV
jgi:hypothetical protein